MLPFLLVGLLFGYFKHGYGFILIPMTILYAFLAVVAYVIFIFVISLPVNMNRKVKKDSKFYRFFAEVSAGLILNILNDNIVYKEKVKFPNERFLLVQNHLSALDPVTSVYAFRGHEIGYITKPENMKLPIVGKFAHAICCLPIDRENPRNAVKTINAGAEMMEKNICSMGVYPEGTRNRKANCLLPFKNGALKMAVKAKAPIVVTTVKYDGNEWNPFVSSDIEVTVLKIILPKEFDNVKTDYLGTIARDAMIKNLGYPPDAEAQKRIK